MYMLLRSNHMQPIEPAYDPVNICCACNEKYAFPLAVCLYSLLVNGNKHRCYDIIVLHSAVSSVALEPVERLAELFSNCTIRFVDMMDFREQVKNAEHSYITAETNYRLAILGELFGRYDRMLYLDCDTVVEDDISRLFDTDLKGNAVGGAPGVDIRMLRFNKKGFFIDDRPSNIEDYLRNILGIREPDRYFNAGVLLFDLKKCREFTSEHEAVELLNRRKLMYNDQDVLNVLFADRIYSLDIRWNYTVNIEHGVVFHDPKIAGFMSEFHREEYGIIHYTGGNKPWNDKVPLWEHYHKYEKELLEVITCHQAEKIR